MLFRIKNSEEHMNLMCKIDCVGAKIDVRRYAHSIIKSALEKRMKEIGAERDWTIAPWDQTFCRNDRSFHVRYSYSANIVADVQFDRGLPIQFDRGLRKSYEISRPILAIESLSDAADFVDACAEYLENGTVPEVETCP